MQRAALLVLIFLVSGVATLGIMGAHIRFPLRFPQASGPQRDRAKTDPGAKYASARILTASGRLREAQDEYLRILQTSPADSTAMRELVGVRRRLAADDPALLRRQATVYRQAIARKVETPEHYSRDSMELLASASLQAAAAIESRRSSVRKGAAARPPLDLHATPRSTKGGAPIPTQSAASATAPAAPPPEKPSPSSPGAIPAAPQPSSAQPPAPAPNAEIPVTPQPSSPPPPAAPPAPAAGQPPVSTEAQETVAVVTPPREPSVTSSQGSLVKIDCQKHTFVLHEANGDEEYETTPTVAIYVRGAQSQRLPEFCGLQSYLGHAVTAWTISGGDRRVAKEMSVAF
jgi:hypothetical protein